MTIVPSFEIGSVTNSPNMYFAKTFTEAKGRQQKFIVTKFKEVTVDCKHNTRAVY